MKLEDRESIISDNIKNQNGIQYHKTSNDQLIDKAKVTESMTFVN